MGKFGMQFRVSFVLFVSSLSNIFQGNFPSVVSGFIVGEWPLCHEPISQEEVILQDKMGKSSFFGREATWRFQQQDNAPQECQI